MRKLNYQPYKYRNKLNEVEIHVTNKCQQNCKLCVYRDLRKADPDYEMTLEQLEHFIRMTQKSGYAFHDIIIFGGEPLLWDHLQEGLRLLKKSKICNYVGMITNALAIHAVDIDRIMGHLDFMQISHYFTNSKETEFMKSNYPEKVIVYENQNFIWYNDTPNNDLLPASCACPTMYVYRDYFLMCGHLLQLNVRYGFPDFPQGTCTRIDYNYLDNIAARRDIIHCSYCLANAKNEDVQSKRFKNDEKELCRI